MTDKLSLQPALLQNVIKNLNTAAGCCSQFIHQRGGDARFMVIRTVLETTCEGIVRHAENQAIKSVFEMRH